MSSKHPEAYEPEGRVFRDFGWWIDNKGYRHYGEIPLTQEEKNDKSRTRTRDSWLYKDTL